MKRLYIVLTAVAMTAVLSSGCVKSSPQAETAKGTALKTEPGSASSLPEITAVKLSELVASSKKPALVNLWATWCEPCKVELPAYKKFRDSKAAEGLSVIFISADSDRKAAAQFLKTVGLSGSSNFILGENADVFGRALAPTWSATLPTTFILDAQGGLKTFWIGETSLDELKNRVTKALTASKPDPALQHRAK